LQPLENIYESRGDYVWIQNAQFSGTVTMQYFNWLWSFKKCLGDSGFYSDRGEHEVRV
jgi:hypothetical protein